MARTSTVPSALLRTHPAMPRMCASRSTNQRKPTPCTRPRTRKRRAWLDFSSVVMLLGCGGEPDATLHHINSNYAGCVQWAQRRASMGISLRHSLHFLLVGSAGAGAFAILAIRAFSGVITRKYTTAAMIRNETK